MNIKRVLFFKAILLSSLILITSCEEDKSEVSVEDHLNLSRLYLQQGAFKASIIEGRNALKIAPNNLDALTTTATVFLKINAGQAAEELTKKAVEIDKENHDTKTLLAKTYIAQRKLFSVQNTLESIDTKKIKDISNYQSTYGEFLLTTSKINEAKDWFYKAHKSDPKNIEAILGLSKSALVLKQLNEVKKYSELAVTTAPNNADALLWSARVAMLQKDFKKAEETLSKLMLDLENYDILTMNKYMAIDMLSKSLLAQNKIEESFVYSNYLAQSETGQIQSSFKNAVKMLSKDRNFQEAEEAFKEVLEKAPFHRSSNIMMGLINYNKGNYTEAEDYLSKFSNDENTPLRSKKVLVLTKVKLRKYDEAIDLINRNIEQHKNDADLHALLGYIYLLKQDYTESINRLKKAIKLDNKNSLYHTHLAQAYLANKDLTTARTIIKKSLQLNSKSDQAKRILVSLLVLNKELNQATKYTKQWIKQSPKSVTALVVAAEIEQQKNNSAKAKKLYLRALKLAPDNLSSNMNVVRLDLKSNDYDKALQRLKHVIIKYPENLPALNIIYSLATKPSHTKEATDIILSVNSKLPFAINPRLTLARIYLHQQKPKETLAIIDKVTKHDNKNIKAYFLKAKAQYADNNTSEAINTYKLLTSLAPDNPASYIELARIKIKQEDYKVAEGYAKQAINLKNGFIPTQLIFFNIGIKTENQEMVLNAVNDIRKKFPDAHLSYELEADYYLHLKQYNKALSNLSKAWKIKKSTQMAKKFLTAYTATNNHKQAFNAWNELSQANKDNFQLQLVYALSLYQHSKLSEAKGILESQLKNHPNDVILLNNLANIYMDLNDKKSLPMAKKALSIQPKNPAIQDTLGWIYAKQYKAYDKAIALLEPAYRSSGDKTIKQHLINTLKSAGKIDQARQLSSE